MHCVGTVSSFDTEKKIEKIELASALHGKYLAYRTNRRQINAVSLSFKKSVTGSVGLSSKKIGTKVIATLT